VPAPPIVALVAPPPATPAPSVLGDGAEVVVAHPPQPARHAVAGQRRVLAAWRQRVRAVPADHAADRLRGDPDRL